MTIPNTHVFSENAGTILVDALGILGISNSHLQPDVMNRCMRVLNRLIKMYQTQGLHLWLENEASVTFIADTASYTLINTSTASAKQISNVRLVSADGYSRVMFPLARAEYYKIYNRTLSGIPTQYYIDERIDSKVMYVYPVPEDITYSISYTYQQVLSDVNLLTDDIHFPTEWLDPIIFNLAVKIAPIVGKGQKVIDDRIDVQAAVLLQQVLFWDQEHRDIQMVPRLKD